MLENHFESPGFWASVLAARDGVRRQTARENLVAMGNDATAVLLRLLEDANPTVRWEAALALKEIRDPAAAEALARAMEDESADVRWVAAEALAAIGTEALRPLLKVVQKDADSFQLRDAAHVAISLLRDRTEREALAGLYHALKSGEPPETVMLEAAEAMELLDGMVRQEV